MKQKAEKLACGSCHVECIKAWECPKCGKIWRHKPEYVEIIRNNVAKEDFVAWSVSHGVPITIYNDWKMIKKLIVNSPNLSAGDMKEFVETYVSQISEEEDNQGVSQVENKEEGSQEVIKGEGSQEVTPKVESKYNFKN